MRKILQVVFFIFVGILAGIFLYYHFSGKTDFVRNQGDSLVVSDVYAQDQTVASANDEISQSRRSIITQAVAKISPAIVSVNVLQVREHVLRSPFHSRDPILREFFPELFKDRTYQQQVQAMGSGFIISENGYILTNDHVVHDAKKIVITMVGGVKADAEIIGSDPTSDIALLKIDQENLQFIKLGNSDDLMIGEWAIAAGNPFGLFEINNNPTVTVGVISAIDRDFGELVEGRIYQDMIQTDASINHGNSGGPLCNALGEVIGMNTFIYTGSRSNEGSVGIGFAIPINRISRILDDLKNYHKVDRDFWIGIKVQNLSDIIAQKMGYNSTKGVLITYIDRGSPAEKAGLQLGDIILEMGNSEISTDQDVFDVVYGTDLRVGDSLKFTIWREGRQIKLTMELLSIRNN
ncbi:S1C family serine protease [Calditrichota bacterium]